MVDPDRRTFIKGIGAATTVGIAGCAGSPESGANNVDLAVAHYQLIQSGLPVYIAEQQGYWEENDIDLSEVTSFVGGGGDYSWNHFWWPPSG